MKYKIVKGLALRHVVNHKEEITVFSSRYDIEAEKACDALNQEASFKELIKEFQEFSLRTFETSTPESCLIQLKKEFDELNWEYNMPDPDVDQFKPIRHEAVDVFFSLLSFLIRIGITPDMFEDSMEEKLEILKQRKWQQNPDNTYSHIKK